MATLPKFLTREYYQARVDGELPSPDPTLIEIFYKYPTDKLNSGFGEYYEELFAPYRYTAKEICEIGVDKGGSLQAWEEYFPKAIIIGVDNNRSVIDSLQEKLLRPYYYNFVHPRIFLMCLDAGQPELKTAANRLYDIVIDDGSHEGIDIINAFAVLWPMVRSGGLYIVEDVASSRPTPSMACDYFADHIYGIIVGDSAVNHIVFRPNMIVVHKK